VSQDSNGDWNFREDECTSVQQRLKPRQYAVEVRQPDGNPITCARQKVALESGADSRAPNAKIVPKRMPVTICRAKAAMKKSSRENIESPATFKNSYVNPEQAERFDSQH
jgi:hypothetical protein